MSRKAQISRGKWTGTTGLKSTQRPANTTTQPLTCSRLAYSPNAVIEAAKQRKAQQEEAQGRELRLRAVDDMLGFLEARTVTRPTENTGKVETLADQVERGEISADHAAEAVRIAIELGNLPAGATPASASIRGQSLAVKSGPMAVYEFIQRLYEGADPLTVLEETAETYIKLGLARRELDLSILSDWRAQLEGKAGKWSEAELVEWFSGQAQAYFVGKSESDWTVPIPRAVRAWLEKMKQYLTELFSAARHLMRLEKEGKLDAGFKTALQQAVGLDPAWAAALRYDGQYDGDPAGQELRSIARGEASGIRDYDGVFLSQRRWVPKQQWEGGDSQTGDTYQLRAVETAVGGHEAYERAKAEGKTELTYHQWLQVRTPEFKAWLGDWEGLRAQQALDQMEPVKVVSPQEWRGLPIEQLRKNALGKLKALVGDKTTGKGFTEIAHPELGVIRVDSRGVKKTKDASRDPAKLLIAANIQEVLPQAIYSRSEVADREDRPNLEGTSKLLARVNIDGVDLVALFTIFREPDGKWYYNTVTLSDGNGKARGSTTEHGRKTEPPTASITGLSEHQRAALRRVNPESVSKAINPRTGEPLVVYHGTTAERFTVFDTLGSEHVDGSVFSSSERVSESYAGREGRLEQVYLMLKNPFVVDAEGANWSALPFDDKEHLIVDSMDSTTFGEFPNREAAEAALAKEIELYPERVHEFSMKVVSNYSINMLIREARRSRKYDGVIVHDVWDEGPHGNWNSPNATTYVVFDPEQIKSATGNRGTFDAANPDITYQLRSANEQTSRENRDRLEFEITGIPQNRAQQLELQLAQILSARADRLAVDITRYSIRTVERDDDGNPIGQKNGFKIRGLDKFIRPISARLAEINPQIAQRLRRFEFDTSIAINASNARISPFLESIKALKKKNAADAQALHLALINADTRTRDAILAKYGLADAYSQVSSALTDIYTRAKAAGIDIGFLPDYFPRKVSDLKALRKAYGTELGGKIEQALADAKRKALAAGRTHLTAEEEVAVINNTIKGRPTIAGDGKPSHAKARTTETVSYEAYPHYAGLNETLLGYIHRLETSIATAHFFGKNLTLSANERTGTTTANLSESIGSYVGELGRIDNKRLS